MKINGSELGSDLDPLMRNNQKELAEQKINNKYLIRRTIATFFSIVNMEFLFEKEDKKEENEVAVSLYKEILGEQLIKCLLYGIILILTPIVSPAMVRGYLWDFIFVIAFLLYVCRDFVRKEVQRSLRLTKLYIEEVLEPLEKQKITEISKRTKRMIVAFGILCIVATAITYWIILPFFNWLTELFGMWWGIVLGVAYGVICVHERMDEVKRQNVEEVKGIYILNEELEVISEEIKKVCSMLNVEQLYLGINESSNKNARCDPEQECIMVDYGLIKDLMVQKRRKLISEEEYRNILVQTITHEMGHLYYKDSRKNIMKRLQIASVLNAAFSLLIFGGICACRNVYVMLFLVSFMYVYDFTFGKVISDIRYWNQIAELKADRMIVEIHGQIAKEYKQYWWNKEELVKEKKESQELDGKGFLYKSYKRYVEINDHPPKWRREYVTRYRKKWYWWEYFEHALLVNKWRWEKKGWRGI